MKKISLLVTACVLGCGCGYTAIPAEDMNAAQRGEATAQYRVGVAYRDGKGVEKSPEQAVEWFKKAALQGYTSAQVALGACYMDGIGVEKNENLGIQWFTKAAKFHDEEAEKKEKDTRTLAFLITQAQKGEAGMQSWLGYSYLIGNLGQTNEEQGIYWLKKAIEQNHAQSMYLLAEYLLEKANSHKDDENALVTEALELLSRGAELKHAKCAEELQFIQKQVADRMAMLKKAAEEGNSSAMLLLYDIFMKGVYGLKDEVRGMTYLHKAVETGDAQAYYQMGLYCLQNRGDEHSLAEARKWWKKAVDKGNADAKKANDIIKSATFAEAEKKANQGDVDSMFELGSRYGTGLGVEKDAPKAFQWLLKAAQHGHVDSCSDVYLYAKEGKDGVPKDPILARRWLLIGVEHGNSICQAIMGKELIEKALAEEGQVNLKYMSAGVKLIKMSDAQGNSQVLEMLRELKSQLMEQLKPILVKAQEGNVGALLFSANMYLKSELFDEAEIRKGVRMLRLAAERGSDDAVVNLAMCYALGVGVEKSLPEARKWWQKAVAMGINQPKVLLEMLADEPIEGLYKKAKQGDADAQCRLGYRYGTGLGVEKDEKKAAELFQKAAEQNHSLACFELADCYDEGKGVQMDEDKSISWLLKSADLGCCLAQAFLGDYYGTGKGVKKDLHKALAYYRKAARQGHAVAMFNLATLYSGSVESITPDLKLSLEWLTKSAEAGNGDARLSLGKLYYNGNEEWGIEPDLKKAFHWFSKAAEYNSPDAIVCLAQCYIMGKGTAPNADEGLKLMRKAVELGHEYAKSYMILEQPTKGHDAPAVPAADTANQSIDDIQIKAADGNPDAQLKLGQAYHNGKGVTKSPILALLWYKKAAEQDQAEAQFIVAQYYEKGENVEKDLEYAKEWYAKAAAQGHIPAKEALKRLGGQ